MARARRKKINPPARLRIPKCPRIITRLLSRVEVDPRYGCWVWQGYKDENGYGRAKILGRSIWLHRAFYALFKRTIADGLEVDHFRRRCVGASCVNPDHLRATHPITNARRRAPPAFQR